MKKKPKILTKDQFEKWFTQQNIKMSKSKTINKSDFSTSLLIKLLS